MTMENPVKNSPAAGLYLTPEQAGQHLGGVDPRTLTKWAREHKMPAYPIGEGKRRMWRSKAAELDQWMEQQRDARRVA